MKKIFCEYSRELHNYLKTLGCDTRRLDDLANSGYKIKWVGSHRHAGTSGWLKGISGTCTTTSGGYVDNGFKIVMTNEFYKKHGGYRYKQETKKMPNKVKFYCAAMFAIMIVLFAGALLTSCSAIKQNSVMNGTAVQSSLVYLACDSQELFQIFKLPAPGSEACKAAMLVPTESESAIIDSSAACIKKFGTSGGELIRCLDGIEGLPAYAKKLSDTKI